ncbi:hypothetical protein D3C71_2051380 [compost metagenome]
MPAIQRPLKTPGGGELAREEACTFKTVVACKSAFASRLAPTGDNWQIHIQLLTS